MLRYLFTNDIRINTLNKRLKDAAIMVQTDSVPSAKDNKSLNNNINTLSFYFNLYKDNNNTFLAMNGDIKRVLINYMEKFQFPNPRTRESFKNSKEDNIRLKPYQEILRLMYIGRFNDVNFYLKSEEIFYFIFLNPDVVNSNIKDYGKILNQIKEYRQSSTLPDHIKTVEGVDWIWKQHSRQINEMLGIMNWLEYVKYVGDKLEIVNRDLSIITKGSLFDILTFSDFLEADGLEFKEFKQKYIEYMDINNPSISDIKAFMSNLNIDKPYQRIFFGAPGTGKSFKLNKDKDAFIVNEEQYERVTFHPDYTYANFVGTYKPVPITDEDGKNSISYEYVPGPFMRTYVKSINNCIKANIGAEDAKPFLLLIEEINRASTAAVFGDIFQLLDRKDNISEYPIQPSEDMKKYLSKETELPIENFDEIRILDNMFIWATMNSADQGVFPMDTAFKRRWDFEYIGINDNEDKIKDYTVELGTDVINWNDLRKSINKWLVTHGVNEDKLLGPFFINLKTLKTEEKDSNILDSEKFRSVFKNKVLMYLYEDAARHKKDIFKNGDNILLSEVFKAFDEEGVRVFNNEIVNDLISTAFIDDSNKSSMIYETPGKEETINEMREVAEKYDAINDYETEDNI